jgi:hypothetical protein
MQHVREFVVIADRSIDGGVELLFLRIIGCACNQLAESSNVAGNHSIGLSNLLVGNFMLGKDGFELSLVLFKDCAFLGLSLVHQNQIFDSIEVLDFLDGFSIDLLFDLSKFI